VFQVNGTSVRLPYTGSGGYYTIYYLSNAVRLQTNFWLSVQFDGSSKLEVKIPNSVYGGLMRGACGADTGSCIDDYRTANGVAVRATAGAQIGNSYVVSDPDVIDPR
jgi:von Willebrand factor type D domain